MYDTKVTNVVFDVTPERKIARRIEWIQGGKRGGRDVTKNDLVLITNGSAVENTAWGDHKTPAKWNRDIQEGSIWAMWRNIAAQDPAFGRPDKFCAHTDKTGSSRHASSPATTRLRPISRRSASATRTGTTRVPSPVAW